jgi:hypothetical protein
MSANAARGATVLANMRAAWAAHDQDRTADSIQAVQATVEAYNEWIDGNRPAEEFEVEEYYYEEDGDETLSAHSLETDASSLYDHRAARDIDDKWDDFDSQATTLEWGGLDHGIDMDASSDRDIAITAPPDSIPVVATARSAAGIESEDGGGDAGTGSSGDPVTPNESNPPVATARSAGVFDSAGDDGVDGEPVPKRCRSMPPPPAEFQVFVIGINRQTLIIWVASDTKVSELKCRIVEQLGWWMTEPENVIVELNGHALQNENTLASEGVVEHTTMRMRARIPGGVEYFEMGSQEEQQQEEEGPPEDRRMGKGEGTQIIV